MRLRVEVARGMPIAVGIPLSSIGMLPISSLAMHICSFAEIAESDPKLNQRGQRMTGSWESEPLSNGSFPLAVT